MIPFNRFWRGRGLLRGLRGGRKFRKGKKKGGGKIGTEFWVTENTPLFPKAGDFPPPKKNLPTSWSRKK